jgi:anti-sigma factor RsiW
MSTREANEHDAALAAYRAAAHAEADAHFDERVLEAQRHKILARLAHLGETARVIRFPVASRGATPAAPANRRWISVAAAAGLIIGLISGQLLHVMPRTGVTTRSVARQVLSPAIELPVELPGPSFVPIVATLDDGLLGEIDGAIELRSVAELRALDELTPFHEPQ